MQRKRTAQIHCAPTEVVMIIKSMSVIPAGNLSLLSAGTIGRLLLGGFVGLMIWEIWARFITVVILGGPLELAGLVTSLVQHWTGYHMPRLAAEAAHYVIGIVGYSVAYFVISRAVRQWALTLDVGVWAIFTIFLGHAILQGSATPFMGVFWLIVTVVTMTRFVNPNPAYRRLLSWGSFTWFNALGIVAPAAGLPFLLMEWGGALSFMSDVGHIIYGFAAAYVFEMLRKRS
jgi:hypothetical protein